MAADLYQFDPKGSGVFRPVARPSVRRINGAYGDRNIVCSCPPTDALALTCRLIQRREVDGLPDLDAVPIGYVVGRRH